MPMRRIAILICVAGLLIGWFDGWPSGRASAQGERVRALPAVTARAVKVDLNRANREELGWLPGMTVQVAERVIQNRPYRKLDELISKKVIGKKHFVQIREFITIGPSGL